MPQLGAPELIIILVIVVLLFGAKKLPELSRTIGTSMQELRRGMSDDEKETKNTSKTESK